MMDSERLNKVVEDLEIETKAMKTLREVYEEIGSLSEGLGIATSAVSDANVLLGDSLQRIESGMRKIELQIETVKTENDTFLQKLADFQLEISTAQKKGISALKERVDEIERAHKVFQRDLDDSIASRLERQLSDTKVEIRNESAQIRNSTEAMLQVHLNRLEEQGDENRQRLQKRLATMTAVIVIVNGALSWALTSI